MKKTVVILFLLVFSFSLVLWATTTTIDFEIANDGYTPSTTTGSGSTDVFNRTNPNIGGNSTYIWAVEDLPVTNPSISLDEIDITGMCAFSFSIDFLTPTTDQWDTTDELKITYEIDGGSSNNLLWVESIEDENSTNDPAALDLGFDGTGDSGQELPAINDGYGVGVSSNFETFTTKQIAIKGNSLTITLQFYNLTSTNEGIYLDNITITTTDQFPNAWINEIHYDNNSTDVNEGVEVILENIADYKLSDIIFYEYNGDVGTISGTHPLDTFTIGDQEGNFSYLYKMISGIQNGAPDGLALAFGDNLITGQFLSYEGNFVGTEGVANGLTSTDIGVSESASTIATKSLQLIGSGTQYTDFTWQSDLTQTWGAANNDGDQSLPVTLSSFSATINNGFPQLYWTTESELENMGWNVYRSDSETGMENNNYLLLNSDLIPGMGTTSIPTNYSFTDDHPITNVGTYWYWLQSVSYSGDLEMYGPISLLFEPGGNGNLPQITKLSNNYPNPFNPTTTIEFSIEENETGKLTIYNVNGQKIVENTFSAGNHIFNWNAEDQASGVYFYKLQTSRYHETKKMILMK